MSTPSANTRSRTPNRTPSMAKIGNDVPVPCTSPEGNPKEASNSRKELLALFENPKLHKDEASRKAFCYKFLQCYRTGDLCQDDILYDIARSLFGMKEYKLVLIGSGSVGKTCFVAKHARNQFVQKYKPTHGVEVTPIVFLTDRNILMKFDVWDCAGEERHAKLRDGYYVSADCGIIMYDVTRRMSYNALSVLHRDLTRVCGEDILIACVGSKADIKVKERKVKPKQAVFPRKKGLEHFLVSNKPGYNSELPLLHLARQLEGDKRLRFVTGQESGDESDFAVATAASMLSLEDRFPTINTNDVIQAVAMSLPAPKEGDDGL